MPRPPSPASLSIRRWSSDAWQASRLILVATIAAAANDGLPKVRSVGDEREDPQRPTGHDRGWRKARGFVSVLAAAIGCLVAANQRSAAPQ